MDVTSGKIRPLVDYLEDANSVLETALVEEKLEELNKRIENFEIVDVPKEPKAITTMMTWGLKKREKYAELLKEGMRIHEAYYCVEYRKGEKFPEEPPKEEEEKTDE